MKEKRHEEAFVRTKQRSRCQDSEKEWEKSAACCKRVQIFLFKKKKYSYSIKSSVRRAQSDADMKEAGTRLCPQ